MSEHLKKATSLALATNVFLFAIKLTVGIISNSITMISEAVNSSTDIISSLAIKYSVRISSMKPDDKHQFGHSAAQPIATFIVAVFAGVLGLNIIQESVKRIVTPANIQINIYVYIVLAITIISKVILNRYQIHIGNKYNSPAVRAQSVDSINDVLASSIALIGIIGVQAGYPRIDGVGGILVAMFILRSGFEIAKENIDYLMGRAADENLIMEITSRALRVKGVEGLNDLRSHYVGDKFHIEIHIEVNKSVSTKESHDIGKDVQHAIEKLPEVQKVFVHIDPV
ncbi:MAG: cation diffusion facilitator family transporter [Bacteroidota bacterium]|nr:cation diffusion facilitator family transporter [Bacteroidota bacterium]MDP4191369.1 cation diffusion facilitator family transporter [Bacteroidota bacterium]MDP4194311.1 cation diffusion facilitator family transporter [Bacteroidota bacterium]